MDCGGIEKGRGGGVWKALRGLDAGLEQDTPRIIELYSTGSEC